MKERDWFWAKGNLHAHTSESDGDASPAQVAQWFRDHGYDFLAITDHDKFIEPASIECPGLLLIPGEELAVEVAGKPIHLNAFGLTSELRVQSGLTKTEAIEANIDQIRAAEAIPMVNHPNWYYAFDHRDLLPIDRPYLMEIVNALDPDDSGDYAHISVEQIWDIVLSAGRQVIATATDDSHHYFEFAREKYNPGRGWVFARVRELAAAAVLEALDKGDFYCSTGVELEDLTFDGSTLSLAVKPEPARHYLIRFVGLHGRFLKEIDAVEASFSMSDDLDNAYIRAKVISDDGKVAWTQAFR